jgi:hypothetical protein
MLNLKSNQDYSFGSLKIKANPNEVTYRDSVASISLRDAVSHVIEALEVLLPAGRGPTLRL